MKAKIKKGKGRPKLEPTRIVSIRVPSPLYDATLKRLKAVKNKLMDNYEPEVEPITD